MSKVAYGVYTYSGATPVGKLGVAEFTGSAINRTAVKDLDRQDPKEFYFKTPSGKEYILLAGTQYDENYHPQDGLFAVYDENLNAVGQSFTTPLLVNLYAFVGPVAGQYYYGIDYDDHRIARFTWSDDKGLALDTSVSYRFDDNTGYGVDLITDGTVLYALFVSATAPFAGGYQSYSLVRLDQDLKNTRLLKVDKEKNPFSIDLYKDSLYITVLGGAQLYGTTNGRMSKIQKVAVSEFDNFDEGETEKTFVPEDLLTGGDYPETADFRALSFTALGDAYILTGRLDNAGEKFVGALHHTTAAKLNSGAGQMVTAISDASYAFTDVSGYTWGLFYSENKQLLWAAQGNDIGVYTYDIDTGLVQESKATITTLADNAEYSLNSVALLEAGGLAKGYTDPAFASVSKVARLAREKLLKK